MTLSGYAVEELRLANGLLVLLLETHEAPIVCISVWYRSGSRDDPPGRTGTAHLLEHMLYKGTQRFPKGGYDQLLHRLGGITNASTAFDRTNYYILITRDRYPTGLELEADRMRGALWSEDDLRDERSVVLNELERNEDDPDSALFDRLQAAAFRAHPYGRPILGRREEVEALTSGDLRAFYDRHYQPANAYLVIAGDFVTAEMRARIEETFGAIPAAPGPLRAHADELRQEGERRVELRKAGGHELLVAGYKVPSRRHPDSYALDVLAHALGSGRTARLYRALVERGWAVDVSAENQTVGLDPFLFLIDLEPARGAPAGRLRRIAEEEIGRIAREGIRADELARARKQARVGFILRREQVSSRAFLVGESEALGSWRLLETYLDHLERVTVEDVGAAAGRYLVPEQSTWAHYLPEGEDEPAARPSLSVEEARP